MIYFRFHIGDWEQKTRLLSPLEKGIYVDLLTYYYSTEHPIVRSNYERITRGYTEEERKAADYVLSTFFTEIDGCYYNKRCEEEISDWQSKSSKSKKAIKTRWDREKKRLSVNRETSTEQSNDDTDVSTKEDTDVCTKGDTDGIPTINHKPKTKNINNTNKKQTEVCNEEAASEEEVCSEDFSDSIADQAENLAIDETMKVVDDPNAIVTPVQVIGIARMLGVKVCRSEKLNQVCSQRILTVDNIRQCVRIAKKEQKGGRYLVGILANAVNEPSQYHTWEYLDQKRKEDEAGIDWDKPF